MVTFWLWAVRNPSLLLAALATASGLSRVTDWSLAMASVLVFGIIADTANHLARHAADRRKRQQEAIAALRTRDPLLDASSRRAA